MITIKITESNKCWQGCGEKETSHTVGEIVKCTISVEICRTAKTKNTYVIWLSYITLSYTPPIKDPILPWRMHIQVYSHISFMDRIWKQSRCPSIDEWLKMWYNTQWSILGYQEERNHLQENGWHWRPFKQSQKVNICMVSLI